MSSNDDEKARTRRAKVFERHQKAAVDGIHLPSLDELLLSMNFLGNELKTDVAEFVSRVRLRVKSDKPDTALLSSTLTVLSLTSSVDDLLRAREAFAAQDSKGKLPRLFLDDCKRRCDFYAACLGDIRSMTRVALCAMTLARRCGTPEDRAYDYAMVAIGWTSTASFMGRAPHNEHPLIHVQGSSIYTHLVGEWERRHGISRVPEDQPEKPASGDAPAGELTVEDIDRIVVLSDIGTAGGHRDDAIKKEFQAIVGASLPLCPLPDLAKVRTLLAEEFPHALTIIDQILSRLSSERHVKFRPFLLIGPPGTGKTTFAQLLLSSLGVRGNVYPCGGVDDSSLMGAPRRWASGEPSMPVALMRRFATASPGIILDELDKVSSGRHNGALHDCLHGLLELQSAAAWLDPYLQVPVDLSHVLWIATANSVQRVPPTLLDRLTCFAFPAPNKKHLSVLANGMLKRTLQSRGYDRRWATPLDGEELAALEAAWSGGSLRALQRLVQVVVDTRNIWSRRH